MNFSTSRHFPLSEKCVMDVGWVEISLLLIRRRLKDFQPKSFFLKGVRLNHQITII